MGGTEKGFTIVGIIAALCVLGSMTMCNAQFQDTATKRADTDGQTARACIARGMTYNNGDCFPR